MKNISYWSNVLIGLPLFFILSLAANTTRMVRQAFRFAIFETRVVYYNNRKDHGLD